LIAPGYVLTAGHVAYGASPGNITFNLNVGGDLTQRISAEAVYTAPGFNGFNPANLANDLAIIKLSQQVTGAVPTYDILRSEMAVGTTLTFVGYGVSGNGNVGVTTGTSASMKRTGQNNADYFVVDSNGKPSVYYFDFDGPNQATNVIGGGTLGNDVETTVGSGDSGSPAFYQDGNGHLWLAGVNTFSAAFTANQVAGTFGTGGGGQVLSDYMGWIDSVVTPVPEPSNYALLSAGLGLLGFAASHKRLV
jgi:secreted trypsin-like serine protease